MTNHTHQTSQPKSTPSLPQTFVGIDVSKRTLDVFVHPAGTRHTLLNTASGFAKLKALLRPYNHILCVLEASGGYERAVLQSLQADHIPVARVQPARVHHFIRAHGTLAKTDRLDAQALALFAHAGLAASTGAMDQDVLMLRDLMRLVTDLRSQAAQVKTSLEKCLNAPKNHPFRAVLAVYTKQEKKLLAQAMDLVARTPALKAIFDCLVSVPGIGSYTALVIMTELPELGQCSKGGIAALVGVAPMTRQSGQWIGRSCITGGRARVRKALYMASITAVRFNAVLKQTYQKLRASGKPPKVALVAIMRKLLITLNAMLKHNTPWQQHLASAS